MPDHTGHPPASRPLPEPVSRTLLPRPRSPWVALGYALGVIAVVVGLTYLAVAIIAVATFSPSGSNK
jgi:hypothetical protein